MVDFVCVHIARKYAKIKHEEKKLYAKIKHEEKKVIIRKS